MIRRRRRVSRWLVVAAFGVLGCGHQAPPEIPRSRFSIIDIHTHFGGVDTWPGKRPNFDELLRTMKEMDVELAVDFKAPDNSLANGVFGDRVTQRIAIYPDTSRFKLFANVPIDDANNTFIGSTRADYPTWVAGILEDAIRRGAVGLKIKDQAGAGAGVNYWTRDTSGTLVPFDSPAFDPLWSTAERLGIPVIVHVGGAYKGEHQAPNGANRDVRWEVLMLQRERVLRKHPRLRFIGAHWAGTPGDLSYLAEILEKYPNMYAEGGANHSNEEFANLDSAATAFFDRYQDQVLFGSDYMENTFPWLKSYRQRLEMILPVAAHWPLADSVMAKYLNGNARRLLGRPEANETPIAHPGFTMTRLLGDTIRLDGTASYAAKTSSMRYRWRQTDGPTVQLEGDTTAQPRFVAKRKGDYAFELTVSTDFAASRPRSVRVNVVPPNDVFEEDKGRVVIEAERFASAIARGGQAWTMAKHQVGFVGKGYMVTGPERATVIEPGQFRSSSPELRYTVWIHQPGTYVVYARGMAPDTVRNTIHFGLDNEEVRLADRVGRFPVGRWGWVRDAFEWDVQFQMMDTTLAVLNVVEPGPHVLNVWMHRDGVMLDRIVLVRAPFAEVSKPIFDVGSGVGPAQSRRRKAPR